MKLCKDCKHYIADSAATFDKCFRWDQKKVMIVVRGNHNDKYSSAKRNYCDFERWPVFPFDIISMHCGRRGRYWEPKDAP